MINNINEIISYSVAFIYDDFTELWVIVNKIYDENPQLNFSELIEVTKIVIDELLTNYKVFLVDENTQKPISMPKEEILRLVESRLKLLNRLPNIGDGIWFSVDSISEM